MYRCVAGSLEGFIQQLAVSYVAHGYWFFVTGRVPEGKDPAAVDAKLVAKYGADESKWSRARRKRAGLANTQYLRHERFFVVLCTHGEHLFFAEEGKQVRDIRKSPVRYGGYSVSFRGGHAHVRIDQAQYHLLKCYFLEEATRRSAESLGAALRNLPFEPYAPVRRQLLNLVRAVNRRRVAAGLDLVEFRSLRLRRRVVGPFVVELNGPLQRAVTRRTESDLGPQTHVSTEANTGPAMDVQQLPETATIGPHGTASAAESCLRHPRGDDDRGPGGLPAGLEIVTVQARAAQRDSRA
ncbi:MAG: hypothetical protein AB7G11_04760 [Phycisphaerales bacterium]